MLVSGNAIVVKLGAEPFVLLLGCLYRESLQALADADRLLLNGGLECLYDILKLRMA